MGPLTEMKTGRGAVLRTEIKIFIYSFNKHLLSPSCAVPCTKSYEYNSEQIELKPLPLGSLHSSGRIRKVSKIAMLTGDGR